MEYFMSQTADRVEDTTTTAGTGAITLSGTPVSGYASFASAFIANESIEYAIVSQGGTDWEVVVGTFDGTTGLTIDTVLSSSNSNTEITRSGTYLVFPTFAALTIMRTRLGRTLASFTPMP